MHKKLIILRGYNGSGKSTTARALAIKHRLFVIGTDTFGWELQPYRDKQPLDQEIATKTIEACFQIFLETGQGIIVDGTLAPVHDKDPIDSNFFITRAAEYGYDVIPVVLTISEEGIRERFQKRLAEDSRATPPDEAYGQNVRTIIDGSPTEGQTVIDITSLNPDEVIAEVEKLL